MLRDVSSAIAAALTLVPLAGAPAAADGSFVLPGDVDATAVRLATADTAAGMQQPVPASDGFLANWFRRVDAARASQPHYAAPLITVTPLLIEQVRFDFYDEQLGNGAHVLNYGGSKGLELIPSTTNEVFVTIPSYQQRSAGAPAAGLTDWQFLLVKQRLLSADEQDGNYILTAFLAAQAPIGIPQFSLDSYVVTPTLAGGKGFGDFDIQATTGLAVPTDHAALLGTAWATNVTFQYRIARLFWPEVEVNWTHWLGGTQRGGLNQVFLTFGAVVGTVKLTDRLGLALGAGYQVAVAPPLQVKPAITPLYQNNFIASARLPF